MIAHFFLILTNNKYMETILVISILLIFLITINLFIHINLDYDLIKNIGQVKVKVFGITVIKSNVSLIAGYFNFINRNKKVVQIKIDLNDKNFQFMEDAGKFFIEKITLTKLENEWIMSIYDPAVSSVAGGYLIVINGIIKSLFLQRFPDAKINNRVKVDFFTNDLQFSLDVGLFITVFDFIWAFVKAGVKRSLYGQRRKFARNS